MIRNRWTIALGIFMYSIPFIIIRSSGEYAVNWLLFLRALSVWFSLVFLSIWALGKGFDKVRPSSDRKSA